MKKLLATLMTMIAMSMSAQMLPYQNAQLTAEQRADDLLGRLTLDEKVKLMMDTSPAIPRLDWAFLSSNGGTRHCMVWDAMAMPLYTLSQWQWQPHGTML